jgi:hypothetical protein
MAWAGSGIFTQTFVDVFGNVTAMDIAASGDTCKVALFNNSVTPAYDAAAASIAFNSGTWVTGNEVSGTGWSSGGVALTTLALATASPAAGQFSWDADDVSETGTTLSNIYGCFIYDDTLTTPVADQGIVAVEFSGAPYSTSNGTLAITWDTNGIFYVDLVP